MAQYHVDIRNDRQEALQVGIQSGSLKFCSGSSAGALAVPSGGVILSEHAIAADAGSVASGQLVLDDADVAEDSSANNSGTITYAVVVKDAVAVAKWLVPSQMSVVINGGSAGLTIAAGLPVDVDSLTVIEGNPA
jgi:hypothetical protein